MLQESKRSSQLVNQIDWSSLSLQRLLLTFIDIEHSTQPPSGDIGTCRMQVLYILFAVIDFFLFHVTLRYLHVLLCKGVLEAWARACASCGFSPLKVKRLKGLPCSPSHFPCKCTTRLKCENWQLFFALRKSKVYVFWRLDCWFTKHNRFWDDTFGSGKQLFFTPSIFWHIWDN